MTINSQYFTEEQIKAGQMQKLLDFLMTEAYGVGDHYNDIHIKPEDCGAFVVEWVQLPWSHEYGGKFEYVEENQVVMTDYQFPDNHYELCYNEEDFQERLKMFLKENPGWVKTSYGTWTNEIENEKFRKELKETSDATGHDWVVNFDEEDEPATASKKQYFENGIPQGE